MSSSLDSLSLFLYNPNKSTQEKTCTTTKTKEAFGKNRKKKSVYDSGLGLRLGPLNRLDLSNFFVQGPDRSDNGSLRTAKEMSQI